MPYLTYPFPKTGLRPRRMGALLSVFALALAAGCATAGSQGAGGSPACTSPGVSANEVRLGLLSPNTGPAAKQFVDLRSGVNARLDLENARGGVNGRKLVYDRADDTGSAEGNLTGARQLIENSHDFAVLEGSVAEQASADYLNKSGVPVTGVGGDPVWTRLPNMFTFGMFFSETEPPPSWGQFVKQHGGTKAAVLSLQFVPVTANFAKKESQSLTAAGIQIAYNEPVSVTGSDLRAVALAMKAKGVDVLTGGLSVDLFAKIVTAAREVGVPLKVILSVTGYEPALLQSYGPQLAGSYLAMITEPFEQNLPVHQAFLRAMADYAPEEQPANSQLSLDGWLIADMAIRGLQLAGSCPSRESFITNLRNVHNYDGGGLISPALDLGRFREPVRCNHFVQVNANGTGFQVQQPDPFCPAS